MVARMYCSQMRHSEEALHRRRTRRLAPPRSPLIWRSKGSVPRDSKAEGPQWGCSLDVNKCGPALCKSGFISVRVDKRVSFEGTTRSILQRGVTEPRSNDGGFSLFAVSLVASISMWRPSFARNLLCDHYMEQNSGH